MSEVAFKITLEGLIDLNGIPKEKLKNHLRQGIGEAIRSDLITNRTTAEVNGYQLGIEVSDIESDDYEESDPVRSSEPMMP